MLSLIVFTLINILILDVRMRLIHTICHVSYERKKIILATLIMGVGSAGSILAYPHIVKTLGYNISTLQDSFTLLSTSSIIFFISYLAFFAFVFYITLAPKHFRRFLISIIIFAALFSAGYLIFASLGRTGLAGYYLIVAFGEERMKFFLGYHASERYKITPNDLILFCLLSALGFCFIENIVYLVGQISTLIGSSQRSSGLSLVVGRGVVNFLVHALFTSTIGFFVYQGIVTRNLLLYIPLGIIAGVSLHFVYDLLLAYQLGFIVLLYLIGGYFWLSYLFYKADRLYV